MKTVLNEIENQQKLLDIEWKDVATANINSERLNRLYHERLIHIKQTISLLNELTIVHAKQMSLEEMFKW